MTNHAAIIARLKTATGPDREIDYALSELWPPSPGPGQLIPEGPYYTASLDAALALLERVRPGTLWELYRIAGGYLANLPDTDSGFAPTPALALLIATLKALEMDQ